MPNSLILQLSKRDLLSESERVLLLSSFIGERTFEPGAELVAEGSRPKFCMLVVEGFAGRHKVLADGGRQITALSLSGDFADLHSFLLKAMAHGLVAMSKCRVALIQHDALRHISETSPHLARLLWLDTLIDASVHREWLVAMGRRPSDGHLAHLICELYVRLEIVRHTAGFSYRLPLTQVQLADVCGMSVVHLNRSMQSLRRAGLIRFNDGVMEILDWERLTAFAEFDPQYLCAWNEPR